MGKFDVLEMVRRAGKDVGPVVQRVLGRPELVGRLVEAMGDEDEGTARYGYEKVVRMVSQVRAEVVYPWFDELAAMLDCDNSFLKWGAILTVANLAMADSQHKFDGVFDKYFGFIEGKSMIAAANVMGSSARIARARPDLAGRIVSRILKAETTRYEAKGKLSPECGNVACGHAIDAFTEMVDLIEDKPKVVAFVRRQLTNKRKPVVRKAERFLRKYGQKD